MERELFRLHRELEMTFVYVIYDQTQAMRPVNQIVVMNDGQTEHSGPVREVYSRPQTAFTAASVGDSNLSSGTVTDIDAGEAVATIDTDFDAPRVSTVNADSEPENLVDRSVVFTARPQFIYLESSENGLDCDVDDVIHRSGGGTQIIVTARGSKGAEQIQVKFDDRVEPAADAVMVGWNADGTILLERISVAGDVNLQEDILGG